MSLTDQAIVEQFQLISQALDAHRQALEKVIEQVGLVDGMVREFVSPETKSLIVVNGILLGMLRAKGILSQDEATQIGSLAQAMMGTDNADRAAAVANLMTVAADAIVGQG